MADLAIPDLPGRPILVTGMPRSGTTWVGRVLCAGKGAGYVNEPFNLSTSPGTLRVPVDHWFPYVTADNEPAILGALEPLLRFNYPLGRELRRCRTYVELLHTLRWWRASLRSRGRRPLVKEPHAVFSAEWFARRMGSDVVVTVRHPLAVVSSWKRLGWSFDFMHLLGQPALVRDLLRPLRSDMERALDPSRDLVDRVALLWHVVYRIVALATFGVDRTVALSYGIVVHALNALPLIPAGYIALHYHAAAVRDRTRQADEQAASREQVPALRDPR
jgi:hypothetical protein